MKSKNKFLRAQSSVASSHLPTHSEIASRATVIWQKKGCIDGQDTEIWLEAEDQLCGEFERRSRIFTAPRTIFDEDQNPTHQVEKHLAEMGGPTSDRSSTSL